MTINDTLEYKRIRVQLHQRGLLLRDIVSGTAIKTKKQQVVRAGDVLVAEIDAKVGGFGLVPSELDGAIVSSHYFTFEIVTDVADPSYVGHLMRWPELAKQVAAQGSTNCAAIRPDDFLSYRIPLPPTIEEQRHVAGMLDRAALGLSSLRLRTRAEDRVASSILLVWLESQFRETDQEVTLSSAAKVYRGRGPRYEPGSGAIAINQACVRWEGIDLAQAREVEQRWWSEVPEDGRVQGEDVLVNSTGEGTIGRATVAGTATVGLPFDSHVLVVRCDESQLLPRYLSTYLRSPSGQAQVHAVKGANTTKQTELGKSKLERLAVPILSIPQQRAFLAGYERVLNTTLAIRKALSRRKELLAAVEPSLLNEAFAGLS